MQKLVADNVEADICHVEETVLQPNVRERKRINLSIPSRIMLEKWFEENISHPYATRNTLLQQSLKTGLAEYKIQRWIEFQRTVLVKKKNLTPYLYFSNEDKVTL